MPIRAPISNDTLKIGERRRLDLNPKMLQNFEKQVTDQITKSVEESFSVDLRSFLQPFEQANSNMSTKATEMQETRRSNGKGKKVKEEPTTPRSRSSPHFFGKYDYERADRNKTMRSSIQTIRSPRKTSLTPSSIIWKGWDSSDERRFKVRCNLRVSVSGAKSTSFCRQVYAMDCDDDCGKYANVGENSYGKFENCYKSSFQDRRELDMDDENQSKERCDLRVLITRSTCHECHCHDREIYVMQCSGDCGELCESQETWKEMLETNFE